MMRLLSKVRWAPIFWLMLVMVTWLMLIELPPKEGGWVHWDKVQHIVIFVMLTSMACLSFSKFWVRACCMLLVYGALVECLQSLFTVTRQASLGDWWADCVGVLLVGASVVAFQRLPIGKS